VEYGVFDRSSERSGEFESFSKMDKEVRKNDQAIRKDVLVENYGEYICKEVDLGNFSWPKYSSKWWKDLLSLDESLGNSWFKRYGVPKIWKFLV
jgi:hypothetical protein